MHKKEFRSLVENTNRKRYFDGFLAEMVEIAEGMDRLTEAVDVVGQTLNAAEEKVSKFKDYVADKMSAYAGNEDKLKELEVEVKEKLEKVHEKYNNIFEVQSQKVVKLPNLSKLKRFVDVIGKAMKAQNLDSLIKALP